MLFIFPMLRDAWKEERRGKGHLPNQQKYLYNLESNLYDLADRLNSGMFRPAPLRIKNILYPKRRKAQVPSQEDKIVQHAIADEYAYYPLVRPLVKEASANTRGRGTDYGVGLLRENLRSFWLKYGRAPYILKGDVHRFFYSIPHDRARELVEKYIEDRDIRAIMFLFIELTKIGLPLGLQQGQLLANVYLSAFDHLIKEKWRIKYYGRHMDDFYVLSDSREELEEILSWCGEYMASIGLELNPKTEIRYRNFDYLGFHFVVGDTGKIITRLAKGKLKSKRRHLTKLARQLGAGELTPERVEAAYFGWRQHACKAKNSRTQVMNIDNYFDGKLKEQGYELMIYPINKGKVRWRVAIVSLQETSPLTENETGTDKGGGTHNVENDCPTYGGHEDLRQRVHERCRDTDAVYLSGP